MRALIAEALGTFCMVFAGTGAIIVNAETGGTITHAGVAITFGLVVMAMIYAFGDVSGAHLNPAVTLAFAISKRFAMKRVPGYVGAQLAGALAASLLLRLLFAENVTLGATMPRGPQWQSFVLEVVLTFMLMLVILAVSSGPREKGLMAGIAIGGVVALEAMFAGPICGASMNPARSIAPAVVGALTGPGGGPGGGPGSTALNALWLYIVAPVLGAALAVPTHALLKQSRE
jgi:aquaporin NIP